MISNAEFWFHVANWACNAWKYKIKFKLLLFVFDDETRQRAQDAGFMVYYPDWYPAVVDSKNSSDYYTNVQVFEYIMQNELVQMGYNVLWNDVDIVWTENPIPYFEKVNPRWDYQMMNDG